MQSQSEVDLINKNLKDKYGRITDSVPMFRVVWSEDQHEYRRGTFIDFHNEIFLREERDTVRYVKKYPHIKDRWILEKYFPVAEGSIPELPGITHSYEPLFVFQSAKGIYLPPVMYVCDAIVSMYLYSEKQVKRTESDDYNDYQKEIDNEAKVVYDFLDDLTPDLVSAMEHGEAVVVPHSYANDVNNRVDVPSEVRANNAGGHS